MSCFLFHGPGARDAALAEATKVGRQVRPPFGEDGLKVDEAREAVLVLSSPAVGDETGVILLGPMDLANAKASDVLLKSLEEHRSGDVLPILWAWDLAEVSHTVCSRCIPRWSLGNAENLPEEILEVAWQLCDAVLEGELYQIISCVQEGKSDLSLLGKCLSFCVAESAREGNTKLLRVWDALRPQLSHSILSPIGVTQALLQSALVVEGGS